MIEFDDDRLDSEEELLLSKCRYCCLDRLGLSDRCFILFAVRREVDDKLCRFADVGGGDGRREDDIDRFRSLLFIVEVCDGIVAVEDDIISKMKPFEH